MRRRFGHILRTLVCVLPWPRQGNAPKTRRLPKGLESEESGQGVTEYSLILGLVVLGIFAAVTQRHCSVPANVADIWSSVDAKIRAIN